MFFMNNQFKYKKLHIYHLSEFTGVLVTIIMILKIKRAFSLFEEALFVVRSTYYNFRYSKGKIA